jgi:trk system potassium uptake protein TrkA
MRIIIGGAGRVGTELAQALRNESKDVVLMDHDARAVKSAQGLDVLVIQGDVTHRSKFIEAGIEDAQVYIAATQSDERNLLSCALAKHAHARATNGSGSKLTTICRLHDPKLVAESLNGDLKEWTTVDFVINPIDGAIDRLMSGLRSSSFEQVIPFGSEAFILELDVTADAGDVTFSTLRESAKRIEGELPLIVGLKRQSEPGRIPNEDEKILPHDRVAVATTGEASFSRILRIFGHEVVDFPVAPRVAIFGAGKVGIRITEKILEMGGSVTIVERDLQKANSLAGTNIASNSSLEIIHGDHLDKGLLSEIEISSHDIAIAALDNDNESIAAALLASDLGVERTGLILTSADLVNVVRRMGITFAVDKNRIAVDGMLAKVHTELPGPYAVLSSISDVVGICLPVGEKVKFVGKALADCDLPEWCKVAFIQRKTANGLETLRPSPSKTIQLGDRMTIFLPPDRVSDLEKRFKV